MMPIKFRYAVITIICILCMSFTACGGEQYESQKKQIIKDFDLALEKDEFTLTEIYNDYGGFPYEGESMYEISFSNTDFGEYTADWKALPFDTATSEFVEFISINSIIPSIEEGKYKFIDKSPDYVDGYTSNAVLMIYDSANNICYYITYDS